MTTPERIQLSRAKGWKMPPNTVKVDRTTKWGNHWVAWRDDDGQWRCTSGSQHYLVPSKAEGVAMAVERHAAELRARAGFFGFATVIAELRGKNLACWCQPGTPCHADVLLELANTPLQPSAEEHRNE